MMKRILLLLVVVLILISSVISFLLATQAGLNTVVTVAGKVIPGKLSVQQVTGRLVGPLEIKNLQYDNDSLSLRINTAHLDWLPTDLMHGIVNITTLTLNKANIVLHENNQKENASSSDSDFSLPVQIKLGNGNVNHFSFSMNKNTPAVTLDHINIKGSALIKQDQLNFELLSHWNKLNYPLDKNESINIKNGIFKLDGPSNHYQYQLSSDISSQTAPITKAEINGVGSLSDINIQNLNITGIHGTISGDAQVNWQKNLAWHANLQAKNFNPNIIFPKINGNIHFTVSNSGQMVDEHLQTQVDLESLGGQVRGYPLQGYGSLKIDNQNYTLSKTEITLGHANLLMAGTLNSNWNVSWQLKLPNLHAIIPDGQGTLLSKGTILGPFKMPQIQANITGANLKYRDYQAANLQSSIKASLQPKGVTDIALTANNIQLIKQKINTIKLAITGHLNQHTINFNLSAPQGNLALQLHGRYNQQTWQGQLNQLTIQSTMLGNWQLQQKSNLTISPQKSLINNFCLHAKQSKICTSIDWKKDKFLHGKLSIVQLSLAMLSNNLPAFSHAVKNLTGNINGDLILKGSIDKPLLQGKLNLNNGSVTIPRLGIIIKQINAQLQANNTKHLKYTLTAVSGQGHLKLMGETLLDLPDFPTSIAISGENFQISNTEEEKVEISPQLQLEYKNRRLDLTGSINVPKAKITPKDFSSTTEMPNDVVFVNDEKQSEPLNLYTDITLNLGDQIHFAYKGLTADIDGDLNIKDTPKSATTATGEIHVKKGKFSAYGQELTIRKGHIVFVGGPVTNPSLDVQAIREVKVFGIGAETSASQNTVVGINITGTVEEPNTELFSIPDNLDQTQILSYLILGRGINSASNADASTLAGAAISLGLSTSKAGEIQNQLQSLFGLSELGFGSEQSYDKESNQITSNTALILGKYLTPRLYVHYSIGLTDAISTLKVSYQLATRWILQTEASQEASGIDIFYTVAKDRWF